MAEKGHYGRKDPTVKNLDKAKKRQEPKRRTQKQHYETERIRHYRSGRNDDRKSYLCEDGARPA